MVQDQASSKNRSLYGAAPAVQRLGVTIELDDAKKIGTLESHGRPSGPAQVAGAHVTAFVVFVEGLRNNLHGTDFQGALVTLWNLALRLEHLPGFEDGSTYVGPKPSWHVANAKSLRAVFMEHVKAVETQRSAGQIPEFKYTQILQDLCERYLLARNAIAGTVDTSRSSKNRGESLDSSGLSELAAGYADAKDQSTDADTVAEFAKTSLGVFDPGDYNWSTHSNYLRLVNQIVTHLVTTENSYPSIYPLRSEVAQRFIDLLAKDFHLNPMALMKDVNNRSSRKWF